MRTIISFNQKAKGHKSRINKGKNHKTAEKDGQERFREKYRDIFAVVPISAEGRMQHFAKAMLSLVPDIFCDDGCDARLDVWLDFCQFYTTGFDPAYSRYLKQNPNLGESYQYKFEAMPVGKLEEELEDCLINLLVLSPEKNNSHKTEMLHQAAKLFELEENISTVFYEELMKE